MTRNLQIGVALVGGYLLGRTKKAKMAIGLGMFLAGKKLTLDPARLGTLLSDSPLFGQLNDQVRRELVDATKSAAVSAVTNRAAGLADSLHERTAALSGPGGRKDPGDGPDDEYPEDDEDLRDDREHQDSADEDDAPPERDRQEKKTAKAAAGKASAGARRRPASGTARRTASGAARKTASGARKAAASGGTKDRGGRNG